MFFYVVYFFGVYFHYLGYFSFCVSVLLELHFCYLIRKCTLAHLSDELIISYEKIISNITDIYVMLPDDNMNLLVSPIYFNNYIC